MAEKHPTLRRTLQQAKHYVAEALSLVEADEHKSGTEPQRSAAVQGAIDDLERARQLVVTCIAKLRAQL